MKITAIFLLTASLQVAANGNGQSVTLSLKDAPIEKAFSEIKKQSGYSFLYNDKTLAGTRKITVQVTNASLEEVLNLCFRDQPLTYSIVDKVVIVKQKTTSPAPPTPLKGGEDPEPPPPIDVSGKVTDKDGKPLEGASVQVKGKKIGTTTDAEGAFFLKGLSETDVVVISFTGYKDQTFKAGNRTSLLVALEINDNPLDEVIVKPYWTQTKREDVGNSGRITAKEIEKQPVQNSLLAVIGRIPGVEITQLTGVNGGGVKVKIQGNNSIGSLSGRTGTDPLIVVDGVPYPSQLVLSSGYELGPLQGGSPLNYINPEDIESIDILKDADATSVYGSRAANGAIIITTKKGKAGHAKISFNLQQGWAKVANHVDMLNTRQYLDMRYEAYRRDGIVWTSPSVAADDLKVWDTTRYTDWQKVLIGGTAKYTNVSAKVEGGNDGLTYLVGTTYNKQSTVFPGDFEDQKGSVHFNLKGGTSEQRLKVQLTGSYMFYDNHIPVADLTQLALLLEPIAPPLFKTDGTLNWAQDAAGRSTWTNPLVNTLSAERKNTTKTLVSSANINYRILKGLVFRSNIGYTSMQSQIYIPRRLELYKPEVRASQQRTAVWGFRNMSTWMLEPILEYNSAVGKGKLEAIVGTTIQKDNSDFLGVNGSGFYTDELMKIITAARTVTPNLSTSRVVRYNALFGHINYNFKNRYLFNITGRRDGSNKFGDYHKFSNFGSAGIGWIFSEEKWLGQKPSFLSFGKLRMSYGITGNDQIGDYAYLSIYGLNNPTVLYQNGLGYDANNIPNPYLKWERTIKWQGGIDLGLLKERIILNFTYARNRSSNQLIPYSLPSFTGFVSYTKNLPATVQNTSCEFTINTVNSNSNKFQWHSSFNLTIPKNILLRFPGIEKTSYVSGAEGVIIGKPLGTLILQAYGGINPADGRQAVDPNRRTVFVTPTTIYYGGISNRFVYRGIQLEFFVHYVRKKGTRDFYWDNGFSYPGRFGGSFSNQPISVLNRWQKPGDNALVSPFSNTIFSTTVKTTDGMYSFDPSFVRLKNVSLSWQLPKTWIQKIRFKSAQLFINGQNLGIITKYLGMDPESGAVNLPPLQTWTTGARIIL